jgi:hypothetical protein
VKEEKKNKIKREETERDMNEVRKKEGSDIKAGEI